MDGLFYVPKINLIEGDKYNVCGENMATSFHFFILFSFLKGSG